MELDHFAQLVDDMIIQHDYPGFEPRSLKLGLPDEANRMPAKTFARALGHANVYVRLAALRWFQERPGMAKPHLAAIVGLFQGQDEFVRMEAVNTVSKIPSLGADVILQVTPLLRDSTIDVRKAAAKAVGKMASRLKQPNVEILQALKEAASDSNPEVRMKVQKAVRLIES
jgi:HEAT repeat protein